MNKPLLVHEFLEQNAIHRPDKTALICSSHRLTYAELDTMANRLANALRDTGIIRGDRVAIYLHNSLEAVVSIFAILKAGAIFVPINRSTKTNKLIFILNNCRASAVLIDRRASTQGIGEHLLARVDSLRNLIICGETRVASAIPPRSFKSWVAAASPPQSSKHAVPASNILSDSPSTAHLSIGANARYLDYAAIQSHASPEKPAHESIDLDPASLIYTSGTTGEPKGVICDHSNVVFVTDSIVQYLKNTELDIVLNVLPLAFSYGLYQLMAMFRVGGTLVLEESFSFPTIVLQKMADEQVTGFAGVPTLYSILLGMKLESLNLSSLRYLSNAAAGLPIEHVRRLRQTFPNVELYLMHGLTEVARTMYLPPDQVDQRPDSSGIAMPGTELWVEDETGRRLGPGEVGELIVRGRHVMRGYWENPKLTEQRFPPGPLPGERVCHTGDLFRTDEEGFYYFVSRKDDIIKSRGEKIAPREVENVIYAIRGVKEVAVIGVPDPVLGQAVKAFIAAADPAITATDVIAHCKAHLEEFMLPRLVEFRAELPKTSSGKIRKLDLI